MALTYEETAALMKDPIFMDRVKIACMKYANYILDEPVSTPAHNTRYKWAMQVQSHPEGVVAQVMPTVVMDNQVQTDGAAITDGALQTVVETAVNKLL